MTTSKIVRMSLLWLLYPAFGCSTSFVPEPAPTPQRPAAAVAEEGGLESGDAGHVLSGDASYAPVGPEGDSGFPPCTPTPQYDGTCAGGSNTNVHAWFCPGPSGGADTRTIKDPGSCVSFTSTLPGNRNPGVSYCCN